MVFSSTLFLFLFLPVTLLGYFLIRERFNNYWLLFVSLIFFAWSQPNYLWIILVNIAVNYLGSLFLGIERFRRFKKPVLIITIIANLAILFYYKYFDFTIESINLLLGSKLELRNIVLPIGISFFTFQGMSYTIDVYRQDVPVQKNPLKVGLYIVLFPQLIAGPIVRYIDIAAEIEDRRTTVEDFSAGIERFIIGLAKKSVLANTMASCADAIWENAALGGNTWQIAWIGSIAYSLQIFFDFSGYSDMAIGLGRMFGFHFNENFRLPYIARSITEFWRRWHISLSTWFRDYVYIPLGGNRKHLYLNLSIVFFLTGVWHGASWHFILWGVWHGVFMLIERSFRKPGSGRTGANSTGLGTGSHDIALARTFPLSDLMLRIYTLLVVNLGWVLFRAPSIGEAKTYLKTMFGMTIPNQPGYTLFWFLDRWTLVIMILAVLFSSSFPGKIGDAIQNNCPEKAVVIMKYAVLLALLYLSMLRIVSGTYNPFIYFQF